MPQPPADPNTPPDKRPQPAVETFTIGTRLTHVTRSLRTEDLVGALPGLHDLDVLRNLA